MTNYHETDFESDFSEADLEGVFAAQDILDIAYANFDKGIGTKNEIKTAQKKLDDAELALIK